MFDWLTNLFGSTEDAWNAAVARFMQTAQQLQQAEQNHLAVRNMAIDTGTLDEWDSLQDRLLYTQQAITDIAEKLKESSQWVQSTFGMNALGFVPLVPIAVITASISAMVALIYALNSYNQNVRQKWDYINSRPELSPQQALDVLESNPSGLNTGIGNTVTWLVIGGIVLATLPAIMESQRGRK